MEALHLGSRLEGLKLDIGPKFKEARHEKEFSAVPAGTLWTIRPQSAASAQANANEAPMQTQVTLPDELAHSLNQLNIQQQAYDRDCHNIESMRKQLFADWYKYMLCAYPPEDARDDYPDIDEVRYFIEKNSLSPLKTKLTANQTSTGDFQKAVERLNTAVAELKGTPYALKRISAPRYWRPNEPVVLIVGDKVKQTLRHGEDGRLHPDGLLSCDVLAVSDSKIDNHFKEIRDKINELKPGDGKVRIGFSTWTQQPWHPFLLEWEVEVFPTHDNSNLHPDTRTYSADFTTSNYQLAENAVDLSGRPATVKAANIYSGRSILTPHAKIQLKNQIEAFLEKRLLPDYYQANNIDPAKRTNDYFTQHKKEIIDWYQNRDERNEVTDNILSTYDQITDRNFYCLAQSLGGFNEALLMHKQTMQLPISDPLGFTDYQHFTEAVRDAVGKNNRVAPLPLNDFNPIRSGTLKILELRLVDTFGRVLPLKAENDKVIATEAMATPDKPLLITLPPRLVQPARLNFRWLSANRGVAQDPDEPEMNAHPATTPVCGWILPNNLDSSLMVYDSWGKALGSINQTAQWTHAPGMDPVDALQIPNPHLKALINHLVGRGKDYLRDFLTVIERALENIDPANFAHHETLALLMGRPIAVVRATLNLELQGQPAINQDWNVFRRDMARNVRETDNFSQVKFPIRIGEYRQLNDGLVGYWVEKGDGYKDKVFYAPQAQSSGIEHTDIVTHQDNNPINVHQSIDDPPQKLTMLVDPRGVVHATCGILPTKAVSIPPDQYAEALQGIEVTFLSTPILTERGQINLPLPIEPGYAWSWVAKEDGVWGETRAIGQVNPKATFAGQQEIREGWVKLGKVEGS